MLALLCYKIKMELQANPVFFLNKIQYTFILKSTQVFDTLEAQISFAISPYNEWIFEELKSFLHQSLELYEIGYRLEDVAFSEKYIDCVLKFSVKEHEPISLWMKLLQYMQFVSLLNIDEQY